MNSCVDCNKELFTAAKRCLSCKAIERRRVNVRNKERRKERALNDLDYAAELTFKKYRQRSPSRGLEFSLTVDDFKEAIVKPCYYCNEDYVGVGLDRIVNSIGYHKENIVPCCAVCNLMKRSSSLEEFIDKCQRIVQNMRVQQLNQT